MTKSYTPLILMISFLAASHATHALAQESVDWKEIEKMTLKEQTNYRQPHYLLVDPVGDYALFKRSYRLFGQLFDVWAGQEPMANIGAPVPSEQFGNDPAKMKEFEESLKIPRPYPGIFISGRENPFDRLGMKKMLLEVIAQERANGIEPTYGKVHEWSQAIKDHVGENDAILRWSKILVVLAQGHSWRYMTTEKENDLIQYLLDRPKDSVTLDEMFRASYRINQGDVYKTILTIENVLSKNWRYPHRERLPVTERLKAFTIHHGEEQDKFGTWYHLWGMILYGYVSDSAASGAIGYIETAGGKVLGTRFPQKDWVNSEGGKFGSDLRRAIEQKQYLSHQSNPDHLKETSYLRLQEDFRDRLPLTQSADLKIFSAKDHRIGHLQQIQVVHTRGPLKGCKVELIYDIGNGFDSTNQKEVFTRVNFENGKPAYFNIFRPAKGARGFISACEGMTGELAFQTD